MEIGDRVVTRSKCDVPRRDRSDSPRDQVNIHIPKGTCGEIVGKSAKPVRYKLEVQGGPLAGGRFWLEGLRIRKAV